jgi:16S rRNA (guanine1516-N2)-methyltransferase
MTLIKTDAINWLADNAINTRPDIIYLDPMFPARQKSAQVKKEMVLLQRLLPPEQDTLSLFRQALACAAKRVVVKRPRLASNLADQAPSYSITGKSSRFDIYVV